MPLQDFLLPDEKIYYQTPFNVKTGEQEYKLILTDRRLVLYKRTGLIFKSDTFIGVDITHIKEMGYTESGVISKQGLVTVVTGQKTLSFSGSANNMKELYKQIQEYGVV
jgi:hypothetical protein